jgi:hypothetical protein
MRVIPILVFIILILSVQPLQVVADTGDANLTNQEETTRGFVFVVVGTVLGTIGYKCGKRVWSNIDESEEKDRSQYYLTENLMKLSIILFLLGILLFFGGIFHIL